MGHQTWVLCTTMMKRSLTHSLASLALLTLGFVDSRKVRWYVNSDVAANVAFAKQNPDALTGWYGCCGLLRVDAAGAVSAQANLRSVVANMTTALPSRRLTFHAVFSVAEEAIHSGAALGAAPAFMQHAKMAGMTGLLCDY